MIIKDDKTAPLDPVSVETPPPYSPTSQPDETSSTTQSTSGEASTSAPVACSPPALPKSNFLTIKRSNTSLKGTYVIDPDLVVPEAMLPALESGEVERKNLRLHCENGSINAEVWLVGGDSSGEARGKRTKIDVRGRNGFVTVKMNAEESHPFSLKISAHNGGITVALPKSFTGPLTMETRNGWVNISASLSPHVTTFSDIKSTRKCFIGDFVSSNYGQGEWEGSSLDIECHNGKVKLCHVDEKDEAERVGGSGFWGKLFGMS